MAMSWLAWFKRHSRALTRIAIGLCLAVIVAESFLLYQQRAVNRAVQLHSAELLGAFLKGDTTQVPDAKGVYVRLQNVRFKWSDKVYVDAGSMAMRALPIEGNTVNFDNLDSFLIAMQQSTVLLSPSVLEGMLNESVFNYPDSKVRDLKVKLIKEDESYAVKLVGKINVVAWVTFSMITSLTVDRATNTLVMNAEHIKVLGFLPATQLTKWKPFHLDRLMTMPPNRSMTVVGNKIMVKPLGLFPPPRITGTMSDVRVDGSGIRLSFAGNPIPAPRSSAQNYVYLRGGTSQFGHFCMKDTNVLVQDADPRDVFGFSLVHYSSQIPRSHIEIHNTESVRVTMPDA